MLTRHLAKVNYCNFTQMILKLSNLPANYRQYELDTLQQHHVCVSVATCSSCCELLSVTKFALIGIPDLSLAKSACNYELILAY